MEQDLSAIKGDPKIDPFPDNAVVNITVGKTILYCVC